MNERVDRDRFRSAYRQAVREIAPFLTWERQVAIARHNLGLHPDRHDLLTYLRASERRYLRAVDRFNEHSGTTEHQPTVLDVGGFLGAFPLALARTGAKVTLVEEYGYYGGALDDLKHFLEREGVTIWPADFTQPVPARPSDRFSLVTNMAMLEHLPSSPRQLMDNLRASVEDLGTLIVEVPNIAYWPNRLRALRGESIHQEFELYYASDPPFMGHHREYAVEELRALLGWSGFDVQAIDLHSYSLSLRSGSLLDRFYVFGVYLWPTLLFRNCREVIMATARPAQGAPGPPDALRLLRRP